MRNFILLRPFYFDHVFLLLPILSISWGVSMERLAEFDIKKKTSCAEGFDSLRLVPKYYWLTTTVTRHFLERGLFCFCLVYESSVDYGRYPYLHAYTQAMQIWRYSTHRKNIRGEHQYSYLSSRYYYILPTLSSEAQPTLPTSAKPT